MAAKRELEPSTPAQQAALALLDNGWMRERIIRGIAETGTIKSACSIIGLAFNTVHRWMNEDQTFAEQVQLARREAGEKVFSKSFAAVLNATEEQLLLHPNLAFHVTGVLLPETKQNGPTINVDARNVTLNQMDPALLEEKAAIYMAAAKASQAIEVTAERDDS